MKMVELETEKGLVSIIPTSIQSVMWKVEDHGCNIAYTGNPRGVDVVNDYEDVVQKINEALADDHCSGCCHESDYYSTDFTDLAGLNSDDGPEPPKFQRGDRVRIVKTWSGFMAGTVSRAYDDSTVRVIWDEGKPSTIHERSLELIP